VTDEIAGGGAPRGSAGDVRDLPHGIDADRDPTLTQAPRAGSVLLALAAAGCLVAACFSHRWLANRHAGDLGYSPLSYQVCKPTCTTITNFQVAKNTYNLPFEEDRVSVAFPVTGLITFIVLLVAAASLVAAAGIAAANQRPNLPVSPTTFALLGLMIGLVTGCIFVATKPGEVGAVGVAWSFWAFGIGSVGGIAAAPLLAKQIRPSDPDLLHDAMNPDQF